MLEYRYHRMTENTCGWTRPHADRLGIGNSFVTVQGFGHEDWNFSKDVWDDGAYHLYLRSPAKMADRNKKFNIALGAHSSSGAMLLGFAENAIYKTSNLPDSIWERRAREVKALDASGQLGAQYKGKSTAEIKGGLSAERELYNLAVSPQDLVILHQPVIIPPVTYIVKSLRYSLLKLDPNQYDRLRSIPDEPVFSELADLDDDVSFPEGSLVERLHRQRERNRALVKLAKERFIKKYGRLHCEACGMEPSTHFKAASLKSKIIEAHHNVKISDAIHTGKTRVEDLSMLCPSCHRAIHTFRKWLTVAELRTKLQRR